MGVKFEFDKQIKNREDAKECLKELVATYLAYELALHIMGRKKKVETNDAK